MEIKSPFISLQYKMWTRTYLFGSLDVYAPEIRPRQKTIGHQGAEVRIHGHHARRGAVGRVPLTAGDVE